MYTLLAHPKITSYNLSSLRILAVGGSSVSKNQCLKASKILPNCIIMNGYGMTEIQGLITMFDFDKDIQFFRTKIGSTGKLHPGFTCKVCYMIRF